VVQIAASFLLVAAAGVTVKTLLALQAARTGLDTQHVLAVDVPVMHEGKTQQQVLEYYREAARRVKQLPGVENVAVGSAAPWRDGLDARLQFSVDGHIPADGEQPPRAFFRVISPAFFATVGMPLIEGRDFNEGDGASSEGVAIVSHSVALRAFPKGDALNHILTWTDPILKAVPMINAKPLRIVGVVPDLDDINLVAKPTLTVYRPSDQEAMLAGGELLIHTGSNPYPLVRQVTQILRAMSPVQPVERPATLEDIRTSVLSPERINVVVASVFGGVALLIAVVGVAGVLAFSVSGRTREFGIRLAVGSQPRALLARVMAEGAAMAIGGLAVGWAGGYGLAQLAGRFLGVLKQPDVLPIAGSAMVLLIAAVVASLVPAARAAKVDVIQALRAD
jgi:predicted permease